MRSRLALVAMLATGCYSPSANPGAPCGPGDACPSGQECRRGICVRIGATDDATSAQGDAPFDTTQLTIDAPADGPNNPPWGTATELTSLETTGSGEGDPSVTADKLTAVLAANTAANDADIYIATRGTALTDTFTFNLLTEVNVAGFNDKSPEISADGLTLLFTSNRTGNYQVYSSTYTTSWSMPAVRTDLSTAGNDSDIAISPDGLTAIRVDQDNANRMFFHTRASTAVPFGTGVEHTELYVANEVAAPTLTNGGETVYFHAGVTRQLYEAHKKGNGTYTVAALVAELNVTTLRTASPFVLEGDDYMIFEIAGDIYETTR